MTEHMCTRVHTHTLICLVLDKILCLHSEGFPDSSVGKKSACNVGDSASVPESGRSPGEGNGNPLQYSYLGNSMDRGAWQVQSMGLQRVGDN